MRRSNTLINSFVNESKLTTSDELKKILKIRKNSSLIHILMQYLICSIDRINYSAKLTEEFENLRTLRYVKPETEEEFKILEEYVKRLKELISAKKKMCENNRDFFNFYTDLEEKISSFLIETCFEMLDITDKQKKCANIDLQKLNDIVYDFIFKFHDSEILSALFLLSPDLCNMKLDGQTIVIKILEDFFLKPNNRDFFIKILILFVSNNLYQISDDEKKVIAQLCDKYSPSLKLKDLIFVKEIITLLGIRPEISCDEKLDLLKKRYDIKDFGQISFKDSYKVLPLDMTKRNVITIDYSNTRVRDGAFSIEKNQDGSYEFSLYTTDVSAIEKGSPLDVYAFNHFATIYPKDAWIPMIFEPVVYKFSLDEGLRRVMAFNFRFNANFELIDCQITAGMVDVKKNLSYSGASEILKKGGELYPILRDAFDLSEAIGDSLGTFDRYHQMKEIVRGLGEPLYKIPEKYLDTPGNRIITTSSMFLNHYIATLYKKNGLPFIYRVNEFAANESIQEQLKMYRHDKDVCDMLKSIQNLYKPSAFSSINTGHQGLGLDAYTSATKPASLYPSLMIQRMLMDLYIHQIPVDEYVKKYGDVEGYAREFTRLQKRNYDFTYEYNKLCHKIK